MSDGNNTHSIYKTINDAVDEAMKFLEPPFNEPLTVESVARAYSILQQQAAEMRSNHPDGSGNAHFRIQQIQSILSNTPFDNQEWIPPQTDLYRALLLSSFLWLELLVDRKSVV